jgi:hypothetical protein
VRRGAPAVQHARRFWAATAILPVVGALVVAWTEGCHARGPDEDLEARARQYLELKQKHDWVAIYDALLDPEMRKTLKKEDFLHKRRLAFDVLGWTVVKKEETGEHASVVAKLDAMIPVLNPRGGTTMMRKEVEEPQKWVNRDGRWYIELAS